MATAAQLAANFANSQRSTGPRSAKGRARSAMNAVKHGMHSKRVKMLREDSIAFENRHIKWMAQANVQDDREEFLTYLNVSQALDCDRILRANEQWIEDLVAESEAKEAEEVYKLGKRLFFDRRGHIELYGIIRCFDGNKTTSPNDQPIEADDPAKLVEELEKSAEGCRWLREEWLELREQLEPGKYWLGYHRIKAVRLLGRQPINAIRDERVAEIFVASYAIKRFGEDGAFSELTSDLTELAISRLYGARQGTMAPSGAHHHERAGPGDLAGPGGSKHRARGRDPGSARSEGREAGQKGRHQAERRSDAGRPPAA